MSDQIYYKIQYPVKKAINAIKKINSEEPFAEDNKEEIIDELNDLGEFLEKWDNEGKENLQNLVKALRRVK